MNPKFFSRPRRDIWFAAAQTVLTVLIVVMVSVAPVLACCPNNPNAPGLNNLGYITPGCNSFTNVTCNSFSMARVNVIDGVSYSFTTCGTSGTPDLEISIYNDATGATITYNDNNGPLCSGVKSSVNYTATFNGVLRIFINDKLGGSCSSIAHYSNVIFGVRQNTTASISTNSNSICLSDTKTLTASPSSCSGGGVWSIVSGGGSISNGVYTPSSAGVKTLKYTYGGCAPTLTFTVVNNFSAGNISGGGGTFYGSADPSVMTANTSGGTGAGTITWYYRNGTTAPSSSNVGTNAGTGNTYDPPAGLTTTRTYRYKAAGFGCNDGWSSNSVTVTVNPAPVCSLNIGVSASATSVCPGSPVTLTASGASTYVWTSLNNISGASITVSPTATTKYYVRGTAANGCVDNDSIVINVLPKGIVYVDPQNPQICAGNKITLNGYGSDEFSWDNGAHVGNSYCVNMPASRYVRVIGNPNGQCPVVDSVYVFAAPLPTVSASASATQIRVGQSVSFTGSGENLQWIGTDGSVYSGASFENAFYKPGVFGYTAIATNAYGCQALASVEVTVLPRPQVTLNAQRYANAAENAGVLTYGVELTNADALPVSVDVVFNNGISIFDLNVAPKSDFATAPALNGNRITLNFNGNGVQNFQILINNDELAEGDETITLNLANVVNADINEYSSYHELTLIDDDVPAIVSFSTQTPDLAVVEGAFGQSVYPLNIELSGAGNFPINVQVALGGSAYYGLDYTTNPPDGSGILNLVFNDNGTQSINVVINGDSEIEIDENIEFSIVDNLPSFVNRFDAFRSVLIQNDDLPKAADCNEIPSNLSAVVSENNVTLSWSGTSNAESYEIRYRVSGQNGEESFIAVNSSAPFTTVSINGLFAVTSYQWDVRAICSEGLVSDRSPLADFTTEGTPEACNAPISGFNAQPTANGVTLSWDAVSNGAFYSIQYRRANSAIWTTINVNGNSAVIGGLLTNTNYQWRVRTFCGSPASAFSAIQSFATSAARIAKAPAAENTPVFNATLYPNPNNGVFEAQVVSETATNVQFRVIDMAGQIVRQNDVKMEAGSAVQGFDLTGQAAGVYLLETVCGENTARVKFVVR